MQVSLPPAKPQMPTLSLIFCPSGVLGPSIPLVAFSICSSFAEKRLWSSLEQPFETESFPFVPAGTKEQGPRLAASVPARVQGLPS